MLVPESENLPPALSVRASVEPAFLPWMAPTTVPTVALSRIVEGERKSAARPPSGFARTQ